MTFVSLGISAQLKVYSDGSMTLDRDTSFTGSRFTVGNIPTIVDFFGQKLKTILHKQNQQAGNYTLQIPISDFSAGTYFLTISSSNQTRTEKIIINK